MTEDFSQATTAEDGIGIIGGRRLAGMRAWVVLLLWRMKVRLGRLAPRMPASLRTRFLVIAAAMVGLVVLQGAVGWGVALRTRQMAAASDTAVGTLMSDLDLLKAFKTMQVDALVSQNLVTTAAADDPVTTRIDLHNLAKNYRAAHATAARIVAERHMTRLGAIEDLDHRLGVAKAAFDTLEQQEEQAIAAAAGAAGKVPADLALQIGGRVDGLYEQLDRLGEGVGLLARADRHDMAGTAAANTRAMSWLTTAMIGAAGVGFLACLVASLFVLKGILHPLASVATATRALAEGDVRHAVPDFTATEIAAITRALAVFRSNLLETDRLKAEQEAHAQRAEEEKRRMMEDLAASFETSVLGIVGEVTTASAGLRGTAQAFSQAAEEATGQAHAVAGASQLAAANVDTVAAAAEQLSASIGEITQRLTASASFAAEAAGQARTTNEVVVSLAEAVDRIGAVVNLIGDIASRTQMLALNATIEAARAGEYGRGFAVVAGEVKALATQTASATAEISGQIGAVQAATRQAVGTIADIAETIVNINEASQAVAAAMEQQGAATREISNSVQQAALGTQEVSATIGGITGTAQEIGQGAGALLTASATLSQQSEALRAAVETFLDGVRGDGLSLRWGDEWLTGIAAVDAEHRTLVQMINDLGAAVTQGRDRAALGGILDGLVAYAERHFSHEEGIWAEGGLPDLDTHRQVHAHLAAKVAELRAEFRAGRGEISGEVTAFLRRWLIDHVFKTDKIAARLIRRGG